MQVKAIFASIVIGLSVSSCSLVYHVDVPQGNYLQAQQVAQLKKGMNARQVQYLLGTPVLVNPYNQYNWYYVFIEQQGNGPQIEHSLEVNFNKQAIVDNFTIDVPLDKPGVKLEAINGKKNVLDRIEGLVDFSNDKVALPNTVDPAANAQPAPQIKKEKQENSWWDSLINMFSL